jgi:molybdopterin molybdotransferase
MASNLGDDTSRPIPASTAASIILDLVVPISQVETVELERAHSRILGQSIASRVDFPHWPNSAMDGYAIAHADVADCRWEQSSQLRVAFEIPAGTQPLRAIAPGEAARIYTGAMLPSGADTIVMQENTTRVGDLVTISTLPKFGDFVRQQGEYARMGTEILSAGMELNPAELAILAACGCNLVPVYRRPRVAIISTGDELVAVDKSLQPGQIIDSNQYALRAFVERAGGIPLYLGIIPDDRARLTAAISEAIATADLVISTGGVSVGDYDYVEEILHELGGDVRITAVAIQPGKPLTVAKFPTAVYFGLPGNPVSALVSCWRFVAPAMNKLAGLPADTWQPNWSIASTTELLTADGRRERYLWGKVTTTNGENRFTPASGSKSSGNLINLAGANALGVMPIDCTEILPLDRLSVLLF